MANIGVRKTFSLILIFYLSFFVLFAFYSFLNFPISKLLSLYRWPFVWANSLILLIDYLIPVTAVAAAVAFSVSFNTVSTKLKKSRPFHKLISANLALLIALTVLYTVLVLGVHPYLHEGLDRLFSLSSQAKVFHDRANGFLGQEEYQAALENFELYLTIDRKNEEILERRDDVQLMSISRRNEQNGPRETKELEQLEEPQASELLARARAYFDREDYYSAHYYATLAAETGNVQTAARRLAGKAWQKISSLEPGRADREARNLFERKKEGYKAFMGKSYVEAYHIFYELRKLHPDDPDVLVYFGRSKEKAAGVSFFIDDAQQIDPLPGLDDLLFVNGRDSEEQTGEEREIVFIGKTVFLGEDVYFKDIEAIRFELGGEVKEHFQAAYGKLIDSYINMNGISREDPEQRQNPRYFVERTSPAGDEDLEALLYLEPALGDLKNLRAGKGLPKSMSFIDLWSFRKELGRYGYIEQLFTIELLMKLLHPFTFLVLSLFAMALGWSFRARYLSRPPIIAYLFIPIFPLVAAFISSLYFDACRRILRAVLIEAGFSVALLSIVVLQGLLLVLALIWLAGQQSE